MTAGIIFAYMIQSALFLAVGLVIYRLVLAHVKMPALNRAVVLAIYAASFVLPALPSLRHNIPEMYAPATNHVASKGPHTIPVSAIPDNNIPAGTATETFVVTNTKATRNEPIAEPAPAPSSPISGNCARIICITAFSGCAVAMLQMLMALGVVARLRRRNESVRLSRHIRLVLLDNDRINPFSILNMIFIPRRDYEQRNQMIIEHELGHITHMHCIDMLISRLCLAVMWWNPAAWMLQHELRAIHEYQADARVLRHGHDMKTYQLLLLKKAAGTRLPSVASSLNHSKLKKRFTMMYQTPPNRWTALRAAVLVPAFIGALMFTGQNSFASIIDGIKEITISDETISDGLASGTYKVTQNLQYGQNDPDVFTSDDDADPLHDDTEAENTDASIDAVDTIGTDTGDSVTDKALRRPDKPADSVWNLDVWDSRSININMIDPHTGGPTINGLSITDAQMEEYLTDEGKTDWLQSFRERSGNGNIVIINDSTDKNSSNSETTIASKPAPGTVSHTTTTTTNSNSSDGSSITTITTTDDNGESHTYQIINGQVAGKKELQAQRKAFEAQRKSFEAQRKAFEKQRKAFEKQKAAFEQQREAYESQRKKQSSASNGSSYRNSLSAEIKHLSNANGKTTVQMKVTSPTTLTFAGALMNFGGKGFKSNSIHVEKTEYTDGMYVTYLTVTGKKATTFQFGKDGVILQTSLGSVKAMLTR